MWTWLANYCILSTLYKSMVPMKVWYSLIYIISTVMDSTCVTVYTDSLPPWYAMGQLKKIWHVGWAGEVILTHFLLKLPRLGLGALLIMSQAFPGGLGLISSQNLSLLASTSTIQTQQPVRTVPMISFNDRFQLQIWITQLVKFSGIDCSQLG